jgi:serine/threonine protein kinase/tetratricopeptide (TPR) repeat protein
MNDGPVGTNRWEEMKDLFAAAVLKTESQWQEFLAGRCGGDSELAAEVQKLLIADRDSPHFLTAPAMQEGEFLDCDPKQPLLGTGQVLCGRFEVLAYLGEGGMGEVYEALDLELNQRIAIKAIRGEIADTPGILSRFKREVYATRRVTHPNVCRTFDLECHTPVAGASNQPGRKITFLTMELLRGETLSEILQRAGALPVGEVHSLALQVGHALLAAHNAGIVHCDLKPSNIFVTKTEIGVRAVVTDFGIAKMVRSQDHTSFSQSLAPETRSGFAGGTPAYMAPEQLERGQCTPRSDIYSFGLILYEALTGERLFPLSCAPQELRQKLDHAGGTSHRGASSWANVLARCLQADPERRFSHIPEMLDALHKVTRVPFSSRPSVASDNRPQHGVRFKPRLVFSKSAWNVGIGGVILATLLVAFILTNYGRTSTSARNAPDVSVAVLAFDTSNTDSDLALLSNGFAENLTTSLAKVSNLRVLSQAALAGLGQNPDLITVGQRLHVDNIVRGSISRAPMGLLVQVALVDAHTGMHRWGKTYIRKQSQLPALQQDIYLEIAFVLRPIATRSSADVNLDRQSKSPAAQEAFLRGQAALLPHTAASAEEAAKDFQQAIDADRLFALAYEQLAECYLVMANKYNRPEAPRDLRTEAENAALRALQLDGTLAAAYADIAMVRILRDFDWDAAEENFNRSLQIDPAQVLAHTAYAFYLLTARGRFAEARAQYAYVDRSSSKTAVMEANQAIAEYFARHYEDSARRAEVLIRSHPEIDVLVEVLADDYLAMNQPGKAVALIRSSSSPVEEIRLSRKAMLGVAFARQGHTGMAREVLAEIESYRKPNFALDFHLGALAAALGDKHKAFFYFQNAINARQVSIMFAGVDTLLDPLRADPRFEQLLAKLNLGNVREHGE